MNVRHDRDEKIELQMTSMIDIVFQLLVFFIMTFKIVAQEGDFKLRLPHSTSGTVGNFEQSLRINLEAYDIPSEPLIDGTLSSVEVYVGETPVALPAGHSVWSDAALRKYVEQELKKSGPGSITSATLILHPRLKYSEVIKVITAISGKLDLGTGEAVKLFERISFERGVE